MPRRVLFLVERFPPDLGGLARSGARTAHALARSGVEVDVVAWTRTLPPGAMETLDGPVRLHRLGLFGHVDLSMQHTLDVLEQLHARRRFDLVWGHYAAHPGFLATWFAQSAGIASTVSARGNDIDQLMFPPGDLSRLLWMLDRATVLTAASADLARKMAVLLGRDPGVVVIPNAVDTSVFTPGPPDAALRTRLGISPDERVLGFSGELRHKKGVPFLFSALSQLRRTGPACLLVIGEIRPRGLEQLEAFRAEHPEDAARVLISGRLDAPTDVARHLRLCDVYLQPSLWDGMPNALLEAMACERLVLASDAGGIPEAISDGRDGFLVPKAELGRLGERLVEVLRLSETRRREVASAARARILAGFQADAEAAALGRVLARACPSSAS